MGRGVGIHRNMAWNLRLWIWKKLDGPCKAAGSWDGRSKVSCLFHSLLWITYALMKVGGARRIKWLGKVIDFVWHEMWTHRPKPHDGLISGVYSNLTPHAHLKQTYVAFTFDPHLSLSIATDMIRYIDWTSISGRPREATIEFFVRHNLTLVHNHFLYEESLT